MKVKNQDIREAIYKANLRNWQVAAALGISEGNFCRKLRFELPSSEKSKILDAISELDNKNKEAEQ